MEGRLPLLNDIAPLGQLHSVNRVRLEYNTGVYGIPEARVIGLRADQVLALICVVRRPTRHQHTRCVQCIGGTTFIGPVFGYSRGAGLEHVWRRDRLLNNGVARHCCVMVARVLL